MKRQYPESMVFLICKATIYLLLITVTATLIYTSFRLITFEDYAKISSQELVNALTTSSEDSPTELPLLRSRHTGFSSIKLPPEWDERLPFSARKELEVVLAPLKASQQSEVLHNLTQLITQPVFSSEDPNAILSTYLALKINRYQNPPEIWGLPAKIVLPILLGLSSLLLIFLCLCVVLLKVERNTRIA